MFCFYCGKVGHSERVCSKRKGGTSTGKMLKRQHGEWLQIDVVRGGSNPSSVVIKEKNRYGKGKG